MAAQILKDFIDIDVDTNKVIQMLLIHDIVEIYAGDMFAFEEKGRKESHKLEEKKAIDRLCSKFNLKQVEFFKSLWLEFEEGITNESKFALSMDRIMPFIQNTHNNGGSWSEFGTTKTQILNHNKVLKDISLELWTYINSQLELAINQGWILDE